MHPPCAGIGPPKLHLLLPWLLALFFALPEAAALFVLNAVNVSALTPIYINSPHHRFWAPEFNVTAELVVIPDLGSCDFSDARFAPYSIPGNLS